jgi:transcriptional regulator with GAF, ATPase, and Fis domain
MAEADRPEELATVLAKMARALAAQKTVQQTLDLIVHYAVELVDGCTAASIMVLEKGRVHALAWSNELAHTSDLVQGELGEGPCFDAARKGHEIYRIPDMTAKVDQWPRYAHKARELGIGSALGFLLFTEEDELGALNLYSKQAGEFTERSAQVGWLLASHAAVAFASARTDAQLQEAMATRHEIAEAMGILMERYKVTERHAFAMLVKSSQNRNVKLREIARAITETGEIPDAP